jgi:CubicO group peptidase (beta-lactamase class C family)
VTGVAHLQALLDEGVAAGVFPSAAAVVLHEGHGVFEGAAGGATLSTVFDLASLTKVLATTATFLALWRDRVVGPETRVTEVLPGSAAGQAGATVADLLAHRAGLPAFLPLFSPVLRAKPRLLEADCPTDVREAARAEVVASALAVVPTTSAGARAEYLYSDIGFIVLGEILARVAGVPLDALVAERVAKPLGLGARFHRLSAWQAWALPVGTIADPSRGLVIAPSGRTRPREPAPGQEGLWEPFAPRPATVGEVDDDNAWVMDGVGGHAGLFGTAADVAAFGRAVLEERAGAGRLAPADHWATALRRDTATLGSTCGLGFHTRVPGDPEGESSAGRLVGEHPPGAAGHIGFTGTSLWIDLGRSLVIALCTNRTAGPRGRGEGRIREFRPRFHDLAVKAAIHPS